jgi:cell division protein FtsA
MTQKNEYIAAVDIGTTKIVALVGRKEVDGKLRILGFGKAPSQGVKRGVVLNIEETAAAISIAVKQAKEASGIDFKDVYVGIAGQHIKSLKNRHSKLIENPENEIKKEDIEELTADMYKISLEAGEEIIHVIPQNYIVDNESGVRTPIGHFGKKLEANFHIVVGQISSAKNINRCINRAGLNVIKLILEPLASADAVLTKDEKEAGVALVDIGGGTTDLAIYYDSTIRHTAVVPFGGNVVTNDIKEGCAILQRHAEELKIKYGSALGDLAAEDKVVSIPGISGREPKEISFKTLAYIIQARMEEIIDTIAFEIENSGYINKLGAGIALTGGGAMLKHLPQLMKFRTGLDVRLAYPKKYITADAFNDVNQPMYSTSVGLLLKGFEYNEILKEKIGKQVKQEEEENQEEVENQENDAQKGNKLIDKFKKTIGDLFNEKDAKL